MKMLYAIQDMKAQVFFQPFVQRNNMEALRGFSDLVNDPKTALYAHPEDFRLVHIGEWDEEKGQGTLDLCEPIGDALSYKKKFGNEQLEPLISAVK